MNLRTVEQDVGFSGIGIHSGLPVKMTVRAYNKLGIFFRRADLYNETLVQAIYKNVCDTNRNTTIGNLKSVHVKTIEHLMAALFIAGVDSALIEINGVEVPILDGGASSFYNKITEAGITKGKNQNQKIIVKKPVRVTAHEIWPELPIERQNDSYVELLPSQNSALNIHADFRVEGKMQSFDYSYDGTQRSITNFSQNLAPARTFGKRSEWEYLRKRNMGLGADEKNTVIYDRDKALNQRWENEIARHKILDAIGDMFTSGGFIVGNLTSYKGNHAMNNMVLRKLFSNSENYAIINT
ncbi:UDP-3-O-[3-hydroxymyristoyl] N-acetylglucosamine deacetylase [bacterium]|nr:UDP-3-O-[3-hydroxymyristoyl] N-acetylglucosamine deacetylase [bacterium]